MAQDVENLDQETTSQPYRPWSAPWIARYIVLPLVVIAAIAGGIWVMQGGLSSKPDASGDTSAVKLSGQGSGEAPRIGQPAPDFTATTLDGKTVKLSDLRGKAVMLNFWATWCPPCRAEMPVIQKVYEENRDKGFEVVAMNLSESPSDVNAFLSGINVKLPVWIDPGNVAQMYRVDAIPATFFIDKDGILRDMFVGGMNRGVMLKKMEKIVGR